MSSERSPRLASIGGAHQALEQHANRLDRLGEKPGLSLAIRTMLAWRDKVLTEHYGFRRTEYSSPPQPQAAQAAAERSSPPHADRLDFNVNETVWVRLTPLGLQLLRSNHDAAFEGHPNPPTYEDPATDEEGRCQMQLWWLMRELGGAMIMGSPLPFETTVQIPAAKLRAPADA